MKQKIKKAKCEKHGRVMLHDGLCHDCRLEKKFPLYKVEENGKITKIKWEDEKKYLNK